MMIPYLIAAFLAGLGFGAFGSFLIFAKPTLEEPPAIIPIGNLVYMVDTDQLSGERIEKLAEALRPKVVIIPFSGRAAIRSQLNPKNAIIRK